MPPPGPPRRGSGSTASSPRASVRPGPSGSPVNRAAPDGPVRPAGDFPGLRVGYSVYLAVSLLLAGALFALPYVWQSPDALMLGNYRLALALVLVAGACISWALAHFLKFQQAFIAVLVTSLLFLAIMNAAAPLFDTKSTKLLAATLKERLKPGDEVASYQIYYQDLPVYLERRITVVDWSGELDFGRTVEDTTQWMTDGATFWKRWEGATTIYMLTDIETYETLSQSNPELKLFPIIRNRKNILLCNKEVKQ
jgi:hypothetical protein